MRIGYAVKLLCSGWLVAGCGSLSAYNLPTVVDTGPTEEPEPPPEEEEEEEIERAALEINAVTPAWGSNGGGSTIEIAGGPFDDSAEVFFIGGDHSVKGTLLSATSDVLTVTVPATSDTGAADIRVRTNTHEGTKSGAFTFWKNGAGKIGLIGAYEWIDEVGLDAPDDWGVASAFFTAPTTTDWSQVYIAYTEDQCLLDYPVADELDDLEKIPTGSATLSLRSGMATLSLARDSQDLWYYTAELTSSFGQNVEIALDPTSSADFPAFTAEGVATTGAEFTVSTPDIHDEFGFPDIDPENFQVGWTTETAADYAVADVYLVQDDVVLERVSCLLKDDGTFKIPDIWTQWNSADYIAIYVGRVQESAATLPHNNAKSGMVGIYWVSGLGLPL